MLVGQNLQRIIFPMFMCSPCIGSWGREEHRLRALNMSDVWGAGLSHAIFRMSLIILPYWTIKQNEGKENWFQEL